MSSSENSLEYSHKGVPFSLYTAGLAMTVIGIVLIVLAYIIDPTRSAFNNVLMLMFLTSVGLGSLFLVAIEYLGGAVWSTPFRRLFEFLASIVLILPIVTIPIIFNVHDLFHWAHLEAVANDHLLHHKAPYLNETFFYIRIAAYYVIWIVAYFLIVRNSKKQDLTKDQKLTKRNIKIAAVFMPFFAISITFASIDFMMSLEAHWFSTIYGVYYFAGTVLAALSAGTFLLVYLNEKGFFFKGIVKDHYYSFGALLFAFVNFWAYIAFSQFLLIWYANLPEETFWYLNRWEGSWMGYSIFLIITHFLVPYFGLLSQPSKMNAKRLKVMSVWILIAHIIDLYWLIIPSMSPKGIAFGWIEIAFIIAGLGLILFMFNLKAKKENLVPIGDPKLQRGIDFRL